MSDYGQHPINVHILLLAPLLASFRPSSDINCEWMQTPAEEYGLQEACHKLAPLGRTFNLLSWGTAPFQVAQLKICTCPLFTLALLGRLRGETVSDLNGPALTAGVAFSPQTSSAVPPLGPSQCRPGLNLEFAAKETLHLSWCLGK